MKAADVAEHLARVAAGGAPVVEVLVIRSTSAEVAMGSRMMVWADRVIGTLGSPALNRATVERARAALPARGALRATVEAGGCTLELFLNAHHPPDELVIVGAGHIARPLARLGSLLGYRVTVLDDRPEFASPERFPDADRLLRLDLAAPLRDLEPGPGTHLVLVTRGHRFDYEILREVLRREVEPAYVGMVGSRRRVRATFEQLVREGISAERLRRVFAPIGLDVGAETPEEIAVAIAAELVRERRGGSASSLRDRDRVVARWLETRSG